MTDADNTSVRLDVAEVVPRLVAMVRKSIPFAEIPAFQRAARTALKAALDAAGMQPPERTLTVWWTPQAGTIDYAPGLFVPATFAPSGEVSLFELPRGRAAHLRMTGPYAGLPGAWQRLFEGCAADGLKLAGLNWEIYAAPDEPPDAMSTDLYALLA